MLLGFITLASILFFQFGFKGFPSIATGAGILVLASLFPKLGAGIVPAALIAILLNIILPNKKQEEATKQ